MSGRKSRTLCGRKDKKSGGALEVHLHFVLCSGRTGLFLTVGFHPLAGIYEGFHPRSDLVFFTKASIHGVIWSSSLRSSG